MNGFIYPDIIDGGIGRIDRALGAVVVMHIVMPDDLPRSLAIVGARQ